MASPDVGVSSEFLDAFYVFVREAAARTYEHLGIPDGLARVPPEALHDATLTILVSMVRRSGGLDAVSFDEARREILARAFDELAPRDRTRAQVLRPAWTRARVDAWTGGASYRDGQALTVLSLGTPRR